MQPTHADELLKDISKAHHCHLKLSVAAKNSKLKYFCATTTSNTCPKSISQIVKSKVKWGKEI